MIRCVRPFIWLLVIGAYWYCTLHILFRTFPIFWDGGGPSASFYWGHAPTPTGQEYDQNIAIRRQFFRPYWIASSVITLLACILTPFLLRRWKPGRPRWFAVSSTTTLTLILFVAGASDIGTTIRLWDGPMTYSSVTSFLAVLRAAIPLSLLAGILLYVVPIESSNS